MSILVFLIIARFLFYNFIIRLITMATVWPVLDGRRTEIALESH